MANFRVSLEVLVCTLFYFLESLFTWYGRMTHGIEGRKNEDFKHCRFTRFSKESLRSCSLLTSPITLNVINYFLSHLKDFLANDNFAEKIPIHTFVGNLILMNKDPSYIIGNDVHVRHDKLRNIFEMFFLSSTIHNNILGTYQCVIQGY